MARLLGLTLSVLLIAVLACAALLYTGTSLGPAQAVVERRISDFLGRQIRFEEPVRLQLGRELQLDLGRTSLANAPWGQDPVMATLRKGNLVVDTASLFGDGPVLVRSISVDGLSVTFERDSQGKSNLPAVALGEETDEEEPTPSAGPPVVLTATTLRDIRVQRLEDAIRPAVDLQIGSLDQRLVDEGLSVSGEGTLQDRPWSLEGNGSDLESHLLGKELQAEFLIRLDALRLEGSYQLPDARELADLTLNAQLSGPLPPRLAALSPVLDAGEAMFVDLDIVDIDPGIRVKVNADLAQLDFTAQGEIDEPGSGDGADLKLSMDAASLPRLAAALDLGESDDVPLHVTAEFERQGRRLAFRAIDLRAGDQQITGEVLIPAFPGTDDAQVDLRAEGPDFSFIQRLLRRPATLPYPYAVNASISSGSDSAELVDTRLRIGDVTARLTGSLGSYPEYRDSVLDLQLNGPDLGAVAALADVQLPASPFQIGSSVRVDGQGQISINNFRASSAGVQFTGNGSLNGYPDYDGLRFAADARIDSLAATSRLFELKSLGEVPATLSLIATGDLRRLSLSDLELRAGQSALTSTGGSISLGAGGIRGDLQVQGLISQLPALLGDYATSAMQGDDYRFDLISLINESGVDVKLQNVQGPGVTGALHLFLPEDLVVDERALLEADIQVKSPPALLPNLSPYAPPTAPLALHAETRGGSDRRQIELQLTSNDAELFSGQLLLPTEDDGETKLSLQGSGDDLRVLGEVTGMPTTTIPYRVDLELSRDGEHLSVDARELVIGGTEIRGNVDYNVPKRHLSADLQVPTGKLQPWVDYYRESAPDPEPPRVKDRNARLIPATPLPMETLATYPADIRIRSGDLGLQDPLFKDASLIRELDIAVSNSDHGLEVSLHRLMGSRGLAQGTLQLNPNDGGAQVRTELTMDDFPIGLTSSGISLETLPQYDLEARFNASGATYRDIAASLDGELLLNGGSGTLNDISISFATESFFAQLLETLLPMAKTESPDMKVQCSIVALRARDGVVALNPGFVLRTDRVDLSARGKIDLNDETLAIRFDNQARKGFGLSAASLVNPYVQITGSLARPALGLDVKNSAIAGGAAVATGGLTVIAKPLFGRFLRRDNPCETALERWAQLKPEAPQTPSPDA